MARDDVQVIGVATNENHGNIIPVHQRPIVIGKPEGRKSTFAEVVPRGVGDVDRRMVADKRRVCAVARQKIRPGGDVACLKDRPDFPQQWLVDLVAVVLEDLSLRDVPIDQVAAKSNVVIKLLDRQPLLIEE